VKEHYHWQTAIGKALRKYGNQIKGEVLAIGDEDYIYELERKAIEAFGTMAPEGYNLKEGGRGGRHTEESKRKISEANLGKYVSEETRKKIGAKSKGRVFSKATRQKMSNDRKGKLVGKKNPMFGITGLNHPCWGKKASEESRLKMSEAQKRRWAIRKGV
jgi:hypothetical protein